MLDVGLVGVLVVWVTGVAGRPFRGPPPARPIRFAVVAVVSATIHLGFHAAATAAPTVDAVALVLAGWSTFGMWCLWLGPVPRRGFPRGYGGSGGRGPGGGGGGGGGGGPGPGGPRGRA